MSETEAILTIAGCCLLVGFWIGWLARVIVGEHMARRERLRGGLLDDATFRRFTGPEPVTSIRTLIDAEEFEWVEP